jgi:hypothetical protein
MGAVRPQTPHRSPRQAFGGNLNQACLRQAEQKNQKNVKKKLECLHARHSRAKSGAELKKEGRWCHGRGIHHRFFLPPNEILVLLMLANYEDIL